MRLPNGYGSVYKLSGKRRKPFIVRKTVGWEINEATGKLKQLYETVGFYETRPLAIKALSDYNDNPYSIEVSNITFSEVYEKWFNRKFRDTMNSNAKAYKMAYKISEPLYDVKFVEIRTEHMQDVIDNCGKGYDTIRKVKVLYNQLFDYAMEHDIVKKDYTEYIVMPSDDEESTRSPFTENEIQKLWDNLGRYEYIDTVLIMIYTGLRPTEHLILENKNIHMDERYMRGGIKTKAGKNRVIPINKKILPLIQKRLSGNKYLVINPKDDKKPVSYFTYYDIHWKALMETLEINHKPHDCRHTCATLLDNAGANKLSIKRILGHATADVTDKYTHKDIEELIKAIDLI